MKPSALSLSIAVLAFAASTIYLALQLRDERMHSEELAEATRVLNARIADLEKAREARPSISGSFGAIGMAPGAAISAQPPSKSEAQPQVSAATMVNAPMPAQGKAFQKMMRSQIRAHNRQMYADAKNQLGLTREEANKLIELLTDQQVGDFGFSPEDTDTAERQRVREVAMRENKAQIADLLGPERLRSLEEYQQSIPARQELDIIARQLEGSDGSTLSEDQRKRLIAAFIEERKRIPMPTPAAVSSTQDFAAAYSDWENDYNARVAAQARNILSSEQYAAYDEYQQAQKEMREQMRHMRIRAGAGDNVMFTTAAPGVIVGEAVGEVASDDDEKTTKER
jgi:hypothetical protein